MVQAKGPQMLEYEEAIVTGLCHFVVAGQNSTY